jgi:hypothetical protein
MLVHQIILTKKPKTKTQTMKNIIRTIKKQVTLFTFCANILVCFASCAYFSSAESKMNEVRQIQRDAKEILDTPSLTEEWDIKELEDAVVKDIKEMEKKAKKERVRVIVSNQR